MTQDRVILARRSHGSRPTPAEFSSANGYGVTRIVVTFQDSPAEIKWQFLAGKWQHVKRWR